MILNVLPLFLLAWLAPSILAQDQVPIYVPFEWSKVPASASVIASSAGTTTFALIDTGGSPSRATAGPATLVQGPSAASMFYVNSGGPTPTLSGVCNLVSPVAVCTLNVYETGAVLPVSSGVPATGAASTPKSSSTGTVGSGSGSSGAVGTSTGTMLSMTTLALGFCIGLAFLR